MADFGANKNGQAKTKNAELLASVSAKNVAAKEEPAPAAKQNGDFSEQERAIIRQVEYYIENPKLQPEQIDMSEAKQNFVKDMERTVYVKGLPLDSKRTALMDFARAYGEVDNVDMRMHDNSTKTNTFKGTIFLTFKTKEQAKSFMEQDVVIYKKCELLRKWHVDYGNEKIEEYAQKMKVRKNKNAIVVFEGAPGTSTREEIREAFEKVKDFEIAFVVFSMGDTKGSVQLTEADSAEKYIAKLKEGKLKLNDEVSLTLRKATEEEEKKILANKAVKDACDFTRSTKVIFKNKRNGGAQDHKHQDKKPRED